MKTPFRSAKLNDVSASKQVPKCETTPKCEIQSPWSKSVRALLMPAAIGHRRPNRIHTRGIKLFAVTAATKQQVIGKMQRGSRARGRQSNLNRIPASRRRALWSVARSVLEVMRLRFPISWLDELYVVNSRALSVQLAALVHRERVQRANAIRGMF